jgi:hypothetical protein
VAGVVRYAPGMAPEQRHAEIHMRHDAKPDTQTHSALLQAGPNDEVDHHRAYDRQRDDAQKQPNGQPGEDCGEYHGATFLNGG